MLDFFIYLNINYHHLLPHLTLNHVHHLIVSFQHTVIVVKRKTLRNCLALFAKQQKLLPAVTIPNHSSTPTTIDLSTHFITHSHNTNQPLPTIKPTRASHVELLSKAHFLKPHISHLRYFHLSLRLPQH